MSSKKRAVTPIGVGGGGSRMDLPDSDLVDVSVDAVYVRPTNFKSVVPDVGSVDIEARFTRHVINRNGAVGGHCQAAIIGFRQLDALTAVTPGFDADQFDETLAEDQDQQPDGTPVAGSPPPRQGGRRIPGWALSNDAGDRMVTTRVGNPMGTRKCMSMELLKEMDREIRSGSQLFF